MLPWAKGRFDIEGPDEDSKHTPNHVYMRRVGYITYTLPIGKSLLHANEAEISARLSSELQATTSNDIVFSSDITLLVNEFEQTTQNVIPDDAHGKPYTWKVSTTAFKPDVVNEITFRVKKDTFYKNGLCIYSPIQVRFR